MATDKLIVAINKMLAALEVAQSNLHHRASDRTFDRINEAIAAGQEEIASLEKSVKKPVPHASTVGLSHQHDAIVLKDKEDHGNGTVTLYAIRISADGIIGHAQDYENGYSVTEIYDLSDRECQHYIGTKVPAALIERITSQTS